MKERKKKNLRKEIMDFGKYDSTETGLMNLFQITEIHKQKPSKSEKSIQNLGNRLNSCHKIPEMMSKETTWE